MSEQQRRDQGGVDLLVSGSEREGGRSGPSAWVWRVAGLLAASLVAVLAGPHLLSSPDTRAPQSSASPEPAPLVAPFVDPDQSRVVPPLRWAPRGPEVGSDFAAAALTRLRAQRQGVDRLLWAGSLDGHDHVVVFSYRKSPNDPSDAIEVAALRVGRIGDVAAAHGETIGYVHEADGLVGLAWQGDDQHTRLLVLGRREPMQVQVSSSTDYNRSGGMSRRWHDAELDDGVLVTDLGRRVDPVLVVRPTVVSANISPIRVEVQGRPETPGADEVTVAGVLAPSYAGPGARRLVARLALAVSPLFDLRDADSRVLWSGRIDGSAGKVGEGGRAALILVRRHDGPTFQAFVYLDPSGSHDSAQAIAVRWSVADLLPYAFSSPAGGRLVLVNPSGPGSVTFSSGFRVKRQVRLDDNGVGTLPYAAGSVDGAGVVVRDRAGHLVLSSHMPVPSEDDPFRPYL